MQGGPRRGRSPITGPTLPRAAQASQLRRRAKQSARRAETIKRTSLAVRRNRAPHRRPNFAGRRTPLPEGPQVQEGSASDIAIRKPTKKEANKKGSKPFGLPPRMSMPRKQIYKFTAPTPGSTCSRACPSESSSASAKALPNNCIPTGMPLSAPRPTGMESPGSPARFSESV